MSPGFRAILLPGGVLPAKLAYADLVESLGAGVDARAKELELYADDAPPPGYTLDHEVQALLDEAGGAAFERFHLVGYSGGGAAALAFTAMHPERLLSLSLLEPGWAGNWGLTREEEELWAEYDRIMELPAAEMMPAFIKLGLREGVRAPESPPGPSPPWMSKRPAGLAAFMSTFKTYDLDRVALGRFAGPVLYILGSLSNPVEYARPADRLADVFADFRLEIFEGRHHFDPPHRAEPERVARLLMEHWARAESG